MGRVTCRTLTFHRKQLEPNDFDLVDIAESALKLHAEKLRRHGVSVDRDFHGPAIAKVLDSEILQVISNLILNAVESLPRGEGRICIRVKPYSETIHITIANNGGGVPEEFASRLFQPHVTSKTPGLGLWLSKRIAGRAPGDQETR